MPTSLMLLPVVDKLVFVSDADATSESHAMLFHARFANRAKRALPVMSFGTPVLGWE